ncbi:MAG: LamG domain-containing protein [Bacteroidetes bacterium]|nr:LamG domain-containing protein [Bacteroidota bacterium]
MKKNYILIFVFYIFICGNISAQGIAINTSGSPADNSAMLDVSGTSLGVLINRMTTIQRDSIAIKCSCTPAEGLQIYNTTNNCLEIYVGTTWQPVVCGCTSKPIAAGVISGTATVCPGQIAVLYSIPAITGATNYIWSYSGSGASIVGSSNAVIVYFSGSATSGNLTVMGNNNCGNGTISADFAIAVNSTAPNITAQPASIATCLGSGDVSFTITATGGLAYQWQEYVSSWNNIANAGIYSNVSTATLTISNPPLGMDSYKYRCVVSGTCTNTTSDGLATLTVNSIPSVPTGSAAQAFCSGASPTVANLAATGTSIQWYAASSGGSALATSTSLVNSSHYYASQTVSGCVSASRFDVTATINTTPSAPTGASSQSFCSGVSPTVANLAATGTSIQWYAASSGGSALATSTALVNNTHYYASQTVNACESATRLDVTATVNTTPSVPTGSASQSFCSGVSPTVANLTASGTAIQWYSASSGGSALATSTPLVNNTHYYASQTANSCESITRLDITATVNTTPTITGTTPGSRSGTGTITLGVAASAGTINWYADATGGSSLGTGTSYTTPSLCVNTTYYVDVSSNGCSTGTRTGVAATVTKSFQKDNSCSLTSNLLSYYKLDDVNDFWSSNNLTNNGSVAFDAGKVNNAANFGTTNTSKYLHLASVPTFTNSNFSISAWVNIPSGFGSCIFAEGYVGNNNPIISLIVNTATSIELVNRDNSTVGLVSTPAISALSPDTWYHFVWTCTSTVSNLYINGVNVDSNKSFTANAGSFNTANIGVRQRQSNDGYATGKIDEVGLWSRVLTSQEISDLFNNGAGQTMQ